MNKTFEKYYKYVLPLLAYILTPYFFEFLELGDTITYAAKVIVTGGVVAYFWKDYKEIKLSFKHFYSGLGFGLLVFAVWVLPEVFFDMPSWYFLGEVSSFVPENILSVLIRVAGAVVIASVVEELFVRSFLNRMLISDDYEKVPIGKFTLVSFVVTVAFFGLSHNRWIVGLITGVLLNLLLWWKKDIFVCIQAHAWANWFLAMFVILTGSFGFW